MTSRAAGCCGSIPPTNTRSAHSRSDSSSRPTLQSASRTSQSDGNKPATVNKPSGMLGYFAPRNSQAARKFQNDGSVNSGYTNKQRTDANRSSRRRLSQHFASSTSHRSSKREKPQRGASGEFLTHQNTRPGPGQPSMRFLPDLSVGGG